MSSTTLNRLSGISLLIGSLLLIIGDIPDFFSGNDQASTRRRKSACGKIGPAQGKEKSRCVVPKQPCWH
jgi:hypothetical protein